MNRFNVITSACVIAASMAVGTGTAAAQLGTEAVTVYGPAETDYAEFGHSLAISGNTLIVGMPGADDAAPNSENEGGVFVYERQGFTWVLKHKLIHASPDPHDNIGRAVAIDGNTILAGAESDEPNAALHPFITGSAFVFVRDSQSQTWPLQQHLYASSPDEFEGLGWSVGLSGDTAVVGSWYYPEVYKHPGGARVFQRVNGAWTEAPPLSAPCVEATGEFGHAVAIHGNTIVVGAHSTDKLCTGTPVTDSGAAYVFTLQGGSWTHAGTLVSPTPAVMAHFGYSVAIHGDDIAVGAPSGVVGGIPAARGSVHFFKLIQGVWTAVGVVQACDSEPGDQFGTSVAIQGDTCVVGAPSAPPEPGANNLGAAYVFGRIDGQWTDQDKLVPQAIGPDDGVGFAVALDGSTVGVGAPENFATSGSGYVAIFDLAGQCPLASSTNYGTGCPGKVAIPSITLSDPPAMGATTGVVMTSSTDITTLGVLLMSGAPTSLPSLGCTLLVAPPFLLIGPFLVQPGANSIDLTIPCDSAVCDLHVYLQTIIGDSHGPAFYAFSPGLTVVLGT